MFLVCYLDASAHIHHPKAYGALKQVDHLAKHMSIYPRQKYFGERANTIQSEKQNPMKVLVIFFVLFANLQMFEPFQRR
jgi:hypothetical protein